MDLQTLRIMHEAAIEAAKAAAKAENDRLGPESSRGFDCGFAWVVAPDVKLNTVEGKALKSLGFTKIGKAVTLWSPAKAATQSISVHYAGASAYAKAMKPSGIQMHAGSRYD